MKLKNILYAIVYTLFLLSGLYSCIDDPEFDSGVHNTKVPDVGELIISDRDITASTITLKSSVLKANGSPVTERGFMWNTDSVRPDNDKDKQLRVGEGIGEYTDTIRNLSPGVLYYFWSYARNEKGTEYSEFDSTSTGSGLGRIKTNLIKELYKVNKDEYEYKPGTRATVSGKINLQGEGKVLVRGVYYSTSETFENKIAVESKTPFEQDSFVCQLSGLSPNTTYYARAFVTNEVSGIAVTTLGDTAHIVTGNGRPILQGILELIPGYSYIDVISQIIHIGDTAIEKRGFCWGTNSEPVIEIDSVRVIKTQANFIVATIENLKPEQQYFIRAYATNKYGTSYGEEQEFYVQNDKPTVQTLDPSTDFDAGTVLVKGLIYAKGKSDIITRGICYSNTILDPKITNSTNFEISATGDNFSQSISGLKGGTKYYIRAYATNSEGISYGVVKEITTPNALVVGSDDFDGSDRLPGSSAYFVIGDKGYLLGGDLGRDVTGELYSFNAVSQSWKGLKVHPKPAKWQAVAVHGNSAYVLGGFGEDDKYMNDFYEYSAGLINVWSNKLNGPPDPAYSRVGVTLEDAAYFIGGMGDTVKNEVWSYDITSDVWVQKPDFPVKQCGGIALNVGNEVYAGMGKDRVGDGICNKTIWKLNADLSTWTHETDNSLIDKGVLAGTVYNDKIYLVDESFYIHEYDLSTKTWTRKTRINASDQDIHGMFVLNDKIYIGLINSKMYKYNPLWDN